MTQNDALNQSLLDIINLAIKFDPSKTAVIVYDEGSPLAIQIGQSYQQVLPQAKVINFATEPPESIKQALFSLGEGDLAVLVQSGNFRLDEFRIRIELFKRGIKVIEHPHLVRITPEEESLYLNSLNFPYEYYQRVGLGLKEKIDRAQSITLYSRGGSILTYQGPFESTKLNIGDYTSLKNTGGQFPIGEVFTEPVDLTKVNGAVDLFAFGDRQFITATPPQPITLIIEAGNIIDIKNSDPRFDEVINEIKAEEPLTLRELGFGLNPAFNRDIRIGDIGTYERQKGLHISLGLKHAVYPKPGIKRSSRFHVDVFPDLSLVKIDDEIVYKDGEYLV